MHVLWTSSGLGVANLSRLIFPRLSVFEVVENANNHRFLGCVEACLYWDEVTIFILAWSENSQGINLKNIFRATVFYVPPQCIFRISKNRELSLFSKYVPFFVLGWYYSCLMLPIFCATKFERGFLTKIVVLLNLCGKTIVPATTTRKEIVFVYGTPKLLADAILRFWVYDCFSQILSLIY